MALEAIAKRSDMDSSLHHEFEERSDLSSIP
jgi:hypothetical protein